MGTVSFFERQQFSPWANGVALGLGVGGLLLLLPAAVGNGNPLQGLAALILLMVSVIMLNVFTMSTWVSEDEIRVQFGRLPLYTKRIALPGLVGARVVDYGAPRAAGGWGARAGRFEGQPVRFLTMGGAQGVLVESGGYRYLVGTRQPEALCTAIEKRLGDFEQHR